MNTARAHLGRLLRAARLRIATAELCLVGPAGLATIYAAQVWAGPAAAAATAGALAVLLAWRLWRRLRHVDLRWAARQLDAAEPALEDSTALLVRDGGLGRLEQLQRARIAERLAGRTMPDLRPPWPRRVIAASWLYATAIVTISMLWGGAPPSQRDRPDQAAAPVIRGAEQTRIAAAWLDISPPVYTGLAAHELQLLDGQAPAGSGLAWRLRFDPQPAAAHLAAHDGRRIPLRREGEEWRAEHVLEKSMLYRVIVSGGPPADATLHRLDAITDHAPLVRVIQPDQNVVYAEDGQSRWRLLFEATDDYGLGEAVLLLTLAQGSGELVDFAELRRAIDGDGDAKERRYGVELALDELGVGPGDDLVAQLEIRDNRAPDVQVSRSASVVLRWPPPIMGDVAGFDGLMQRTLPAYFRSQRQIIIDTEQLVADRGVIPDPEFVARSNAIGVDQQGLRLRYGQFMGEESESGDPGSSHDDHDHALPAASPAARPAVSNPLFADDAAHAGDREDEDDHDHGAADHDDDAPPAGATGGSATGFGAAGDVIAQYGHLHDIPEAATLLDPETKEVLRDALRAMWDAEGFLRVGEPASALPHEYRALELIKEVQRADRVYLARVGMELPPIDESRRLSGDIEGVTDRMDPLRPADEVAAPLHALWVDLENWQGDGEESTGLEEALGWVLAHETSLEDPLGLVAAIDAVLRDPACRDCRQRLRGALWPALPTPPAGVLPRAPIDAAGLRYLEALGPGDGP